MHQGGMLSFTCICMCIICVYYGIGWLRSVGSFKSQVSFAEYSLFHMAVLAKETCNFKEPTSHSHSIAMSANPLPSALSMPCHTWVGDRGRNIKRIHYAPRRSAIVYARWYAQEFLKSRLVTQLHIENLYGAGF